MTVSMDVANYQTDTTEETRMIRRVSRRVFAAIAVTGTATLKAFAAVGEQYAAVAWTGDVTPSPTAESTATTKEDTAHEPADAEERSRR